MSRTTGEGRAPAEKAGRVIDPNTAAKRKEQRTKEEAWASMAGPVTVTQRPDVTIVPAQHNLWETVRMNGFRINSPFIVRDPACPKERHPTRDCGCKVFKSEIAANRYRDEQNRATA